ncbi:MAG: hypothetical protein GC171_11550 [Terrimonas sp.]|nr:hypothetical protein [Terrimonas sp.]
MKKIFASMLPLLLLIFAPPIAWAKGEPVPFKTKFDYQYTSADFKTTISFPAAFEESFSEKETTNGIRKTVKVSASLKDDVYFFSATKHVVDIPEKEKMATVSVNSFTETIKGEIKKKEPFTYNGNTGAEALIYLPEQNAYVHYRALLIDRFQYQFVVIDKEEGSSEAVSRFFASFAYTE